MKTQNTLLLTISTAVLASCVIPNPAQTPVTTLRKIKELGRIPVGRPTPDGKTSNIISPYRPYNIIDIKGHKSGDIVGDPSTSKINPSTGKLDISTFRYFRIP